LPMPSHPPCLSCLESMAAELIISSDSRVCGSSFLFVGTPPPPPGAPLMVRPDHLIRSAIGSAPRSAQQVAATTLSPRGSGRNSQPIPLPCALPHRSFLYSFCANKLRQTLLSFPRPDVRQRVRRKTFKEQFSCLWPRPLECGG